MTIRLWTGSFALLAVSTALVAQQPVVVEEHDVLVTAPIGEKALTFERAAPAPGPGAHVQTFAVISAEMSVSGKVVKGAPYSAEAVTETVQALADGNRIARKNSSAVYRDGEGRTRKEQTLPAIGPWASAGDAPQIVTITDPVADATYVLNSHDKSARKMKGASPGFGAAFTMPDAGAAVMGTKMRQAEPAAPAISYSFERRISGQPASDREKTENLGKQNIEGIMAEGTRTTFTIPAGEAGNERPIDVVSERWYSPELQTVVMTKHSDPRMGETTYKLTRINRSEPARSLFEIPADYDVKENPMTPLRRMRIQEKEK